MVTVANTKMMVSPASRMLSAISFGVFCRSAPSTSLIMRSIKVEPWAAVMRTRIQSDSTWVPPVTAERSPRDRGLFRRIERQHRLQAHQRINDKEAADVEQQHRDRIGQPVLLAPLIDAANPVDPDLDRPQD